MNPVRLTRCLMLLTAAALPAGVGAQAPPRIDKPGEYPPGQYTGPCSVTAMNAHPLGQGGRPTEGQPGKIIQVETRFVETRFGKQFGYGDHVAPPQCRPLDLAPGTWDMEVVTTTFTWVWRLEFGTWYEREQKVHWDTTRMKIVISEPPRVQPCATVTFVRGPVVVIAQGRERPVEKGDAVPGGEEIVVKGSPVGGELGPVAQVELADGSILRLGPGTRLRCDEANYEPEHKSLSFRARLIAGQIWAEVQNAFCKVADCVYVYDDWGGALSIRGTSFTVEVRKPWMQVRVYASETSVGFVRNTCGPVKKEVVVRAGYESVVDGCNPPTEPRKFTPPANPWWEMIER